jgi:hypothetical protein
MWKDVVATIMQKTDGGSEGVYQIRVRSSAMARDEAIRVSRDEYAQFHPGMLVTVFMMGWGPLSAWRLRRDE